MTDHNSEKDVRDDKVTGRMKHGNGMADHFAKFGDRQQPALSLATNLVYVCWWVAKEAILF
jgi:hypothetical protein